MPAAQAQGYSSGDYGNDGLIGQVGSPMFTPKESTRLGAVLSTSNFELAMPLFNLGGRGLATNLNLYYNSNLWGARFDQVLNSNVYTFEPIQSWPSPGFSLGFGRIIYYDGYTDSNQIAWHKFMLIDPDGTRHALGTGQDYGNNTLQTSDGSHLTYVGNAAAGGTLHTNDGTAIAISKVNNRLLPTMIIDTNGNYIQIAYKWQTNFPGIALDYIVDTLGRVIQFNYDAYNITNLTSISGPTGTLTFNYQTVTMNTNFQNVIVQNQPASFSAVSNVTIPARPQYQFTYSSYGMIYQIAASSTGGNGMMAYDYPLGGEALSGFPAFTQRTETGTNSPTAVYSYGSNGVTRPNGTVLYLSSALQHLKNNSGTILSKTDTTYTTDPGGSPAVQSIITTDDTGQQTKADFDYDQYGNVINKRDYGYKISGQWQVRRRTHYAYVATQAYLDKYIRSLVNETDVYDALLNINDADDVLIDKAVVGYDSYGAMGGLENYGGTANPPGHFSSYDTSVTIRGNLTGVTTYSDVTQGTSVTRNKRIDIFGNTTKAQVSCCNEKTFYCDGHTYWARPCTITSGNPLDKCLTAIQVHDFNTLMVTSLTNANNQTTTYSYDAALRLTGRASPTGASATAVYNVWGEKTSSSATYNEGGTNKTLTTTAVYDGWGQITQSIDAFGAQTNYTYDAMGDLQTQTNPFPQGSSPGPVTTNQYDLLGRVTMVTLPGGNTEQTAYSGSIVTTTDQVNRKIKRENDGLGRLIKVTEQDGTGALTQETIYTYDVADRLIGVNQGSQTRTFKYDSEGRVIFERLPEQTASINDGTGIYWTTKYAYTDWGAIATKQDARGVVVTYTYDSLHRLTSVSYNTGNAPGVASTPTVTYTYDTTGTCDPSSHTANGTTKGLPLSITVGTGYSESYAYDDNKRVQAVTRTIDGRNYTTSYQYDTANQMMQLTYASNRVINIGHDAMGRVTSVGSYLSSVTYNSIGQMTGDLLGNGVTEGFSYDPNRMQLTSQTATQSGGTQNGLMNLAYGYNAQAGQMGAGTMAGNAGQLLLVSGTLGGTTGIGGQGQNAVESASFTYDNVGRIVTSNQTSNGSSTQRRFAYDRWGNRTGVWDATNGGNQIQSVVLQQSGGVPTNQITSVTNSGTTLTYSYDAAGNVSNDGVHNYTYDAENRLVGVAGGTTASYAYDQRNQRYKKTVGSSVTHYVWQSGQVLAEHNGSTGSVITDYIYSGSRMVAKVTGGLLTNYILNDRLSARLTLDTSGNVVGRQAHLPFGEDFAESGTQQKQHFTSYEREGESGTDYAINRQYNQGLGRFMRVDSMSGSIAVPQSLNRYAYAKNDPINRTDPTGLDDIGKCFDANNHEVPCEYDPDPNGQPEPGDPHLYGTDDPWFMDDFLSIWYPDSFRIIGPILDPPDRDRGHGDPPLVPIGGIKSPEECDKSLQKALGRLYEFLDDLSRYKEEDVGHYDELIDRQTGLRKVLNGLDNCNKHWQKKNREDLEKIKREVDRFIQPPGQFKKLIPILIGVGAGLGIIICSACPECCAAGTPIIAVP